MRLTNILFMLLCTFSIHTMASTQDEIDHLLEFVANMDCQYERNGTLHNGKEAVEHINKKYAYYLDDIESTEDFIKYSATKSSMSGKHYKIHCKNTAPINSQNWLLTELTVYRNTKNTQ